MKIKIGDKVKFLNEVGGGIIKKIIDKNTIEVLTEDEFEIPMPITELIVVENAQSNSSSKVESPIKEEINYEVEFDKNSDEVAIFIGFIHKNQVDKTKSAIDFYLINDSNFYFDYTILKPDNKQWESVQKGIIEPNSKELISTILLENAQQFSKLHFQGYFFRQFRHEIKPVVDRLLEINTKKFFQVGSFQVNDFFEEDAIIYSVEEEDKLEAAFNKMSKQELKKMIKEKEQTRAKKKTVSYSKAEKKNFDKRIIDLHITELIDDETGLSAKEILDIQMTKFKEEIVSAIHEGVKRIVFIHGVGNGRLKLEVRKELERNYKKYEFQDASFAEYGYGATMVILGR